jgi:hypothetical protein
MFILLKAKRIKQFGYKDKYMFQIVSISSPYNRTTCLISRKENSIKVDPNSIVLGLLVSKVLRLGEQKIYITGGIIGIRKEKERKGKKIRSLISEITRKNKIK